MNLKSDDAQPKFGTLRKFLFPVQKIELKKVLWISLFFTLILFVYNLTKGFKYIFINKYAVCGAPELLPCIKLFLVPLSSILSFFIFEILVDKFGRKRTFNIIVSTFAIFFMIFSMILFPFRDTLHPNCESVAHLRSLLPNFCYYVIPCFTNWSFTLYYIAIEIWGGLVIPVLFWQFANRVTMQSEVGRLFGMYVALGHVGTISAGAIVSWFDGSSPNASEFDQNIIRLIIIAAISSFAIILIHNHVSKVFFKDLNVLENTSSKTKEKKNIFVSAFEGIKILFTNSYVRNIIFMVLGYYVLSDLTEIVWHRLMHENLSIREYSQKMGNLSFILGVVTIVFSLLASFIMQKFRWKIAALLTPLILLVTGGSFIVLSLLKNMSIGVFQSQYSIKFIITMGLFAVSLIKSSKFSIFDITKNISYRPLDETTKIKGQAAVEVLGSKLGKSSSSAINYTLTSLISVGSKISDHLHILIVIFSMLIFGWIKSVFSLSKSYEEKIK